MDARIFFAIFNRSAGVSPEPPEWSGPQEFPSPMPILSRRTSLSVLGITLAVGTTLQASGFQLREQSPSAQGLAFAGVSAQGFDISSMFFNPATMTAFEGNHVVLGMSFIAPVAKLQSAAATRANLSGPLAPFGGTRISGPARHGDAANDAVLPNLYALWSMSPRLKVGFSVNAPFGLVTDYDADFLGRYHALKSDLKTVDLAFQIAYNIHPRFSVGATLLHRTVEAELTNAVDFGQIAFLALAQAGNPAYTAFTPSSTSAPFDGRATIQGKDRLLGYKVGFTLRPVDPLILGVAYHGATKPELTGTVTYHYPNLTPPLASALQAVVDGAHLVPGPARANVELPDTLSVGLAWEANPNLTLALEAARTGWHTFRQLRVTFGSGQADSITEEHWRDTWYVSLGATWRLSNRLQFRAGLASDQGAVPDAYRTPRIPDQNRTWFSAGLGYRLSDRSTFDLGLTHIRVQDGRLELRAGAPGNPDFFRGNLSGTYASAIDILAASWSLRF